MNPKSSKCTPKQNNFMSKAMGCIYPEQIGLRGFGNKPVIFYKTVSPKFWDKSYRANAERKRRKFNVLDDDK